MSHLPADDRQLMIHNYRQVAEILSMFRRELLAVGTPRWLVGMLMLRQFEMMTREFRLPSVTFIGSPFDMEQEEDD